MLKEPQRHIRWSGEAALTQARECLNMRIAFEIELPANLHHALFAHLFPAAPPGESETIDMRGGSELIERIATIAGLETLRPLGAAIATARAVVTVLSPHPRIVITWP